MLTDIQTESAVVYNKARGYAASTWRLVQGIVGCTADGNPGPVTADAVALYQKNQGLPVDGKVGSTTLRTIGIQAKPGKYGKYDIRALHQRFPDLEFGIDVSNYQGIIDWGRVFGVGVKFSIAKATEGRTHQQKSFGRNVGGAHNYNIPTSAYHLARLTDKAVTKVTSPEGGADNFLEMLSGVSLDLPPFLDLEHKQVKQMVVLKGSVAAVDWINAWLNHFDACFSTPVPQVGLYLSHRTAALLGTPKELTDLTTWWAYYKSATWGQEPKRRPGWDDWAIRQFTSGGRVPGISGDVDLNYANDSIDKYLVPFKY